MARQISLPPWVAATISSQMIASRLASALPYQRRDYQARGRRRSLADDGRRSGDEPRVRRMVLPRGGPNQHRVPSRARNARHEGR
jgi:hypothetical protein